MNDISKATSTPSNKAMEIIYACPLCSITVNIRKTIRRHLRNIEKIALNEEARGVRGKKGKSEETIVSDLVLCLDERYT
jgi:hypothetical protein